MPINEINDSFEYDYSLFRSGEYKRIMNYLSGTDRAISNLLANEGATIKTIALYLGENEEFIEKRVRYIERMYDDIYDEYSDSRGR